MDHSQNAPMIFVLIDRIDTRGRGFSEVSVLDLSLVKCEIIVPFFWFAIGEAGISVKLLVCPKLERRVSSLLCTFGMRSLEPPHSYCNRRGRTQGRAGYLSQGALVLSKNEERVSS